MSRATALLAIACGVGASASCSISGDAASDPSQQDTSDNGGDPTGSADDPSGGSASQPSVPSDAKLVSGLTITAVAFNQGIEVALMQGGKSAVQSPAPIVAGRQALVRVYVEPKEGFMPQSVLATLQLTGASSISTTQTIAGASSQALLGSTINFEVPQGVLTSQTSYSVSLYQTGSGGSDGPTDGARWPQSGTQSIGARSTNGPFEVVIVPFRYHGDGSGRMPAVDDAHIEAYRNGFLAMYPVPDVKVTLHAPADWQGGFTPTDGNAMSVLLQKTCSFRQQERPAANVYYLGVIAPAEDYNLFCSQGCVAGVGKPVNAEDPTGRCAAGFGFDDPSSIRIATHELGHALGRNHAPCSNVGVYPQDVDPKYPHAGGAIGAWGYDFTQKELLDPTQSKDVMGYCKPDWISDYTYGAMFDRIAWVNGIR